MSLVVLLAVCLETLSQLPRDKPVAATAGTIEGRVTIQDAQPPSPVRRARVTLTGGILSQAEIADTDPEGRYRFEVAAGSYRVTVGKPGFVTSRAIAVDVKAGDTATANVILARGAVIEGRLQNDAGEPVEGATVSAIRFRQSTTGWERILVRQTVTDDQGRYRLHSVPPGDCFVEAKPDPFRGDDAFLPREERPAPLALTFFPGTVQMHEARPVGLSPGQEVSGIDFVVLRVPAGPKNGAAGLAPLRGASPDPPQPARTSPSGRISGRVVAMNTGKAIRFATVVMTSQQGRQSLAQTDAQGRYEFSGLTAGTYRLDASARHYQRIHLDGQPYSASSAATPRGITLRDDEQFDVADFSLSRGGAIDVRLVDEFGDPAPGLRVQLSRVRYSGGRRRWTPLETDLSPTDDRGYVRLSGLAPGSYYVSALSGALAGRAGTNGFPSTHYPGTSDPSAALPVSVVLEQQLSISFQLTPARLARLAGRVVDASGAPTHASVTLKSADSMGLSGFITLAAKSDADGAFVFRAVPPGTFMLQAHVVVGVPSESNLAAAQFGWLALTVDGTDQQELMIRVATGRSLKGRVVSDDSSGAAFNPREVSVTARPVEFDFAPTAVGRRLSRLRMTARSR